MATSDESTANEAIKDALKAIQRARELSERAGYGSLVVGPLVDAQREAQYALDTALGRN
jgi:hypothetical protein